jgi:replicative DNA helicase
LQWKWRIILALPNSKESEQALLGALLITPNILDRVDLEPEAFFDPTHQDIYRTMRLIGSEELDVVVLGEALERQGDFDPMYLLTLTQRCPSAYNYETYIEIIRDTSARRRAITQAENLAKSAFDETQSLPDAISIVMSELVKTACPSKGAVHLTGYLKELYEEAEERAANPREIYGLETGLRDFDRITHGLQKGEQFVLAGAPGTGKSLLAFQLGYGMANAGHSGAVYELEMTGKAVLRRKASAISKIPTYNMLSGKDMDEKWDRFVKAIAEMEKLPIYISQESHWTTVQMRADLSRLKQMHNIEWFIVDYMGLLADNYGSGDLERQAYISHQLRAIAKDLELAGLTLQSVNKAGYNNPSMANVSGPTAIHHDADQIAILTKNYENENLIELRWEKNREGNAGRILTLIQAPGFPSYECIAEEREEPIAYWQKD